MNPDVVSRVFSFCGNAYIHLATVSKTWRRVYVARKNTSTSLREAVGSESRVQSVLPTLKKCASLNEAAFYHASISGDIGVLERLLANKRPLASYTCTAGAVAGGHVSAVMWAVLNGFLLDRFVCHSAASAGNLCLLRWAVRNRCPWDPVLCRDVSKQNGHLCVERWIGCMLAEQKYQTAD